MLTDFTCLRRNIRFEMCCYISIFNEYIFRSAYLIRSCPKGYCIDVVLKYFAVFIYLNLLRLVADRFEIFAGVFLKIQVHP